MKIHLRDGLPFIEVTLHHQGHQILLPQVLLDTGSAGTSRRWEKSRGRPHDRRTGAGLGVVSENTDRLRPPRRRREVGAG
ncbi:MAG: hypothetical protein U5O69_00345 [Candidatus Competibacteraceae bacterium]|nr:hypothetical protein [Candidatus Competibacteraceae bacterium]